MGTIVVDGTTTYDEVSEKAPAPGVRAVAGCVTLPGRVDQVGVARAFTRRLLHGDPVLDTALLVVSELASNSVQHSRSSLPGGTVTLYVLHVGARVRIEVHDDGADGVPHMRPAGSETLPEWDGELDELDLRGRGLRLVDEVTACWGFAIGHRRTTTWAELTPAEDIGIEHIEIPA
ncbi:ATP-binding protein [Sphaerisporangium sp. NPDC051011]|uniref:ATP-binding protein n=1 Tax=Sphaerisporangium sp. NPDC051011 TaxID=3155792 RepID=UPI0033D26F87